MGEQIIWHLKKVSLVHVNIVGGQNIEIGYGKGIQIL